MISFLLLSTLATVACGQWVYDPIPVSFITPGSQKVATEVVSQYLVPLCGGCQFDGQYAKVAINLANHKWSVLLGDVIFLNITDVQGHLIATNIDPATKAPATDFKFQYKANYGDLHMVSKTGTGTSYVFTVQIEFDYNTTMSKVGPRYHNDCQIRHEMNAYERLTLKKMQARGSVIVLIPIFKFNTDAEKIVPPDEIRTYRLDYCFGPKSQYNVTITTLSTLRTSGFSTYVCVKDYKPAPNYCDVLTPFRDTSGAGANFVNVGVKSKDFGPMYVIIRGEGRYGIDNRFTIAGSSYY